MNVKKVIDKNDLRKLMKEKASTTSCSQKKVESSFAKYPFTRFMTFLSLDEEEFKKR